MQPVAVNHWKVAIETDEGAGYEFADNNTQITKQIGLAVPVNLAAALVGALMRR